MVEASPNASKCDFHSGVFGVTGIGFSITRQIVAKPNGEINCESKQDVGRRFWVDIPISSKQLETDVSSPLV